MARFSRIDTVLKMEETGVVPVFYHSDVAVCKEILTACYEGGIRVFEFTNRGDFAHEVFRELNLYAEEQMPDMILGIGSVIDEGTASLYIQLGTNFVVSPLLNDRMARVCNRRKVAWMPGCGSVTEIGFAEELGAEVVKIFPASQVGGPAFIKGVKGPSPWTSIMPTGGVTTEESNLKEWFDSGAMCVGIGSHLFAQVLKDKDYTNFKNQIKILLNTVSHIRSNTV